MEINLLKIKQKDIMEIRRFGWGSVKVIGIILESNLLGALFKIYRLTGGHLYVLRLKEIPISAIKY